MGQVSSEMTDKITREEILEVFRESELPVLSAKRVADEFGVQYQRLDYHLRKLVDEGELVREKFGPSVVYWLPDD